MNELRQLILGTRNAKKGQELADLLSPLGVHTKTLLDIPEAIEIVEDGTTFDENAGFKASRQARHLKQWVLGEDSGLCVLALDGAPGVYSARFSGEHASDEDNNRKLLDELAEVPDDRRGAYYVCHMALSDPQGEVVFRCQGECHGRILRHPRGSNGFGYDPLFEVVEYHQTFGELGPATKSVLSHRARAMRALFSTLSLGTIFQASRRRSSSLSNKT